MHKTYTLLIMFFLAPLLGSELYAQLYTSPYSRVNIGDLVNNMQAVNAGMGGVGISNSRPSFISHYNPAQLSTVQLTHIDVSVAFERREKNNSLTNESGNGTSISNITMGFPLITNKWGFLLGLQPISSSSFSHETTYNQVVEGYNVRLIEKFSKSGGLSSIVVASGLKLMSNLSLGAKIAYLFGDIKVAYDNNPQATGIGQLNKTTGEFDWNVSDFIVTLGSKYQYHINDNKVLNLGLIYQFSKELNTKKIINSNLYTRGRFTPLLTKQLSQDDEKINYPSMFGLGLSYDINKRWIVGLDVRTRDWSSANFDNYEKITYRVANSYHLGVELIPKYDHVNNYFMRVVYRAGISYNESPWLISDANVNEWNLNIGFSFPLQNYSLLNFGFTYGTRGQQTEALPQETYYRFILGISFNDRWFLKRQLN